MSLGQPDGLELLDRADKLVPVAAGARRRRCVAQCGNGIRRLGNAIEHALRRCRPDTGQQVQHAKAGDAVARILDEPQQRQHVLDVRRIEKFQPAEFHERNIAPGQLDLERAAVVEARNSTACCFSAAPSSRFSRTRSTM